MRGNPPPDDWDDLYSERELAEIEELNQSADERTSIFQGRWMRLGIIAVSLLILVTLLVPTAFLLQGRSPPPPLPTPTRQIPSETFAVSDFELQAAQGGAVRLSEVIDRNDAVVLVFYRGYF